MGCCPSRRSTRPGSTAAEDVGGVTGVIVQLGPFGGAHDAGPLLLPWIVVYLALIAGCARQAAFARRDL